jgi:DNA-directed RNA polymerase specialized sigma24 family protein
MGKPREIADEIGIDVTEVYQILRRIREKISK